MYSVKRSVAAKVNWNLTVNILEDWTLWIWDSSSNTKSEQCFNLNFFSSFSEICLLPKIFTEREEIVSFVGQATIDFFSRLPPACLDLSFFQLNVLKPFKAVKAKWQEISFLDYVSFAMVFHSIFPPKKIKNFSSPLFWRRDKGWRRIWKSNNGKAMAVNSPAHLPNLHSFIIFYHLFSVTGRSALAQPSFVLMVFIFLASQDTLEIMLASQ